MVGLHSCHRATRFMKRTAILVIAATNQPVYLHYINTHWTRIIEYTNAEKPHIDVFLLFENAVDLSSFSHLRDNIIQDNHSELSSLCERAFHGRGIPGILSKTLYALELLEGLYDVFFRTNLSSVIKLSQFDRFVQTKDRICYSGAFVWVDSLRKDLLTHERIGPDKSIKSLADLDAYKGNTFISGSGYFLNAEEARSLVARKEQIRFDIVDDVSVGLMLSEHEMLPGFSLVVTPDRPVNEMISMIEESSAGHVRLQHFPLPVAEAFWRELRGCDAWR